MQQCSYNAKYCIFISVQRYHVVITGVCNIASKRLYNPIHTVSHSLLWLYIHGGISWATWQSGICQPPDWTLASVARTEPPRAVHSLSHHPWGQKQERCWGFGHEIKLTGGTCVVHVTPYIYIYFFFGPVLSIYSFIYYCIYFFCTCEWVMPSIATSSLKICLLKGQLITVTL